MNSESIRVDGEVIVIHCWACEPARWADLEARDPGETSSHVCGTV